MYYNSIIPSIGIDELENVVEDGPITGVNYLLVAEECQIGEYRYNRPEDTVCKRENLNPFSDNKHRQRG